MYREHVERIKTKLYQAQQTDSSFKVFGAGSHKYKLGECATRRAVEEFENKLNIELPLCYKTFLLEIGNGGTSFAGSAAGPYYGIYPLGQHLEEILETPKDSLALQAIVRPGISDEEWELLTGKLDDDDLPDEAYEQEMNKLYAGVLPLGSQGCTYIHALVVTGEHAGRVVNIDLDLNKPRFCFESNFLDWYERWLDEVISGTLLVDGPSWFGYTMGGDAKELLRVYLSETDPEAKYEALSGMGKLLSADEASCDILLRISSEPNKKLGHLAAQVLTKFSYSKAKSILADMIEGNDVECLAACQALFWYQREHADDWIDQLRNRLKSVENSETFDFVTYLIEECKVDYALDLIPFLKNRNLKIRIQSFYLLGKLKNKQIYLNEFIVGLSDASSQVVHITLQALEGVKEKALLNEYFKILQRFPKEKDYVLVNLKHRLKEQGFGSNSDFSERYNPETGDITSKTGWLASTIKDLFDSKK